MAPALGVVYLGVRREALGARTQATNHWIYPNYDLEKEYAAAEEGRFSDEPFGFVSLASLKDPDNAKIAPPGIVNLQVMGLAPSQAESWGVAAGEDYQQSARYEELKARYAARLMRTAERVFPSLSQHVVFQEVATPLTHTRYTSSTGGTSYGIAATPDQFLLSRPAARTELPGLLLCGASTRSGHGIMGAMASGLMAASQVLGRGLVGEVLAPALPAAPAQDGRSLAAGT
jgi:phytoene dehydrogenase-like protein